MASRLNGYQLISYKAKVAISKKLNPATGADWRQLAGHLKFTDVEIQNFESRNGANPNYNPTLEVLRAWEHRFSHGPNLNELVNALRAMERFDVIGIIDDMLDEHTFWDEQDQRSHSRHSSGSGGSPGAYQRSNSRHSSGSGGSPRVLESQPLFLPLPPADEVFRSELENKTDSRREPVEHSFGSVDSADLNYHGEAAPPPLPPNFRELIAPSPNSQSVRPKIPSVNRASQETPHHRNQASFPALNHHGHPSPQKKQHHQNNSVGNLPWSNDRSREGHSLPNSPAAIPRGSPSKESQESKSLPINLQRTNSWEKTHPPAPFDTNTWPTGKKIPKENNNPHAVKKASASSSPSIRPALHGNPGDYGGTHPPLHEISGEYYHPSDTNPANSMPLPQGHYGRTTSWPQDHRQVGNRANTSQNLRSVSQNVSPAPRPCKSGIAYGITFAWKDWKCGMELAKKLKREGHHVEVDRKFSWYDNEADRNRRLPNVFNSCRYIIVIITPDYEREIAGDVKSSLNTRFIHGYMKREFERNGNRNERFIPIIDTTRIQQTEEMFRSYPVAIHQYIIGLILRQGAPRPQNRGVIVERQYSLN